MTLAELVAVFRSHLYLPDPSPLYVVLATVVANRMPGDPVWLLLVAPPSSGKTELLSSLSRLADVHDVSTFTEAGLLSGSTSRRPGATGGLLAEVGRFGLIVCKDFTSVLSESHETRAGLLAALREIYDGAWCRRLGVDGGRTFSWQGKAGLLAAVTETVERYAAVIGAMGERFVTYRLPALSDEDRLAQGRRAAANAGKQAAMRAELAEAVAAFLAGIDVPCTVEPLGDETSEALVLLADLGSRCRSAVERDPRDREVELVPHPEALGRFQAQLTQLLRALWLIGVPDDDIELLLAKLALDALPKARRAVLELLADAKPLVLFTTAQVADALGLPTGPTGRALADLAAHGVITRHADQTGPHRWEASAWLRQRWQTCGLDRESAPVAHDEQQPW